jgi:hypothetical protein
MRDIFFAALGVVAERKGKSTLGNDEYIFFATLGGNTKRGGKDS